MISQLTPSVRGLDMAAKERVGRENAITECIALPTV